MLPVIWRIWATGYINCVTGDDGQDMLLDCLDDEPAITHLIADPTRPTTTKTRFTVKGHQLLRVDDET